MEDLRLYLFGMPRLEYKGAVVKIARRKALALAAYLALADRRQSRDVLATLLWPDQDRDHARSALRSTLRELTTATPAEWIYADRSTLGSLPGAMWVDVQAFTATLSETESHGHAPQIICADCLTLFKQAADLYRAPFLDGFSLADSREYEDWQSTWREWLHREYADVLRRQSVYHSDAGRYDLALKYGGQWLAADPLHEPAQRHIIRLYALSGQRSEALRQYKQAVELLDSELATPPETETIRLYESILNDKLASPDVGTAPSAGATSVLPPLPPLFIGRAESLSDIKNRLGIGGGTLHPVTVIQGWPGVGKTTIVSRLAHDPDIARYFPDGVLWVSLGETPNLLGEISRWADALGLSEPGRIRLVDDISAQITARLRDKRMLLIVDDVWQDQHARHFRVGGAGCALVITSRLNDVATALAPTAADLYRLPVLTDSASIELLKRLTPETTAAYPAESRQLVKDLEGLPLAINVAGRLLHSEARLGWGIRELLAELGAGAGILTAPLPSDMAASAGHTPPTVAALLKRSTDLLDPDTRSKFALLGLFVPKPATFDLAAMAVAWDVSDPRPAARILVNRGLLEPISGGRFQMHALLILHASSLLTERGIAD